MLLANRVEAFAVTVTAGTAKASAVETATTFADGTVTRIELDVPAGHARLTGIQILWAHAQVIPFTVNTFLVADNDKLAYDMQPGRDTGQWAVKCFNTDVYDHTFYLRFGVQDYAFRGAATVPPPTLVTPVLV